MQSQLSQAGPAAAGAAGVLACWRAGVFGRPFASFVVGAGHSSREGLSAGIVSHGSQ